MFPCISPPITSERKLPIKLLKTFALLCLSGLVGCLPIGSQLSNEPEKRLDATTKLGSEGLFLAWYISFNEPHFVSRIVVHPDHPVKGVDVYVSVGKDKWQRIKHFKKPVSADTRIAIGRKTDTIRVLMTSPYPTGYIQRIEAFGY